MTGSLLVLAKQPLHLTPDQVRFLAVASTMMTVVGGFIASTFSDHYSRKTIMLIGVAGLTFFTLLLTLVQTGDHRIEFVPETLGFFCLTVPFLGTKGIAGRPGMVELLQDGRFGGLG